MKIWSLDLGEPLSDRADHSDLNQSMVLLSIGAYLCAFVFSLEQAGKENFGELSDKGQDFFFPESSLIY